MDAFCLKLLSKNLIVLRGAKGYVMCGYLDMAAADKFGDVAVKITGVATIEEARQARVSAGSRQARQIGICEGQLVEDVLKIIA